MKYSKRDRELAANLCSARASLCAVQQCEDRYDDFPTIPFNEMAIVLGIAPASKSAMLACAAFGAVDNGSYALDYAEAESLIRGGWS